MAVSEPTRALHELTAWALNRGLVLDQLTVEPPSLEDVYLRLTGPGSAASADEKEADDTRACRNGPAANGPTANEPGKGPGHDADDRPGAAA